MRRPAHNSHVRSQAPGSHKALQLRGAQRLQGVSSMPALGLQASLWRAPPMMKTVHIYEHIHEHSHIICRRPPLQALQALASEALESESSPSRPSMLAEGSYPSASSDSRLPVSGASPSGRELLPPVSEELASPEAALVSPFLQVPLHLSRSYGSWSAASRSVHSGASVEWPPSEEDLGRTGISQDLSHTGISVFSSRPEEVAEASQSGAATAPAAQLHQASQASQPLLPRRSTVTNCPGGGQTMLQWTRYIRLAEDAGTKARKARPPGWGGGTSALEERHLQVRLELLAAEGDWSQRRKFVQRQMRELPDSSKSNAKLQLAGAPVIVHGSRQDKLQLDKLKERERHQNRDLVKNIQGAMQDCSRSRQQLVRIQQKLKDCTQGPSAKSLSALA
ncbi:unnamed protein product [Polarella glacialis]|uniref:Uncharacterized protein n=1 Tax=Polarella glacialis TaxID=89957 RepID=A0A813F814_POLGL|nr:unnamed protein product [Polarella glacialis]